MKVMFVFLNDRKRTLIPLNISLLKAMLDNNGFETKVFDTSFYPEHARFREEDKKEESGTFKKIDYKKIGVEVKKSDLVYDFLQEVNNWHPDLVAFSVHSTTFSLALKLASALKQKYANILTLFGGIHVSIEPENVIGQNAVDLICLGEGEEATLELCKNIKDGKAVNNVRNIWLKDNSGIIRNPLRPVIEMDSLPTPTWNGFDAMHHYAPFRGKLLKTALIEFSRTCPFNCGYCGNNILTNIYLKSGIKIKPRHKSPEKFVKELKYLKNNYGIEFVSIVDGTFLSFPISVFENLAELYRKEINLPFYIDTTVTTIDKERVRLLKKMGCICVNMGIECGNEQYRRKYLLKDFSDGAIIKAFRLVRQEGIEVRSYNIIGLPFETREDIFETIELNRICKADSVSLSIFVPYPGTYLREVCIENNLIDKNQEIVGDGTIPNIKSDFLSNSQLIGIYNTFLLYIKAPKIFFPLIKLCELNNWLFKKLRNCLLRIYNA